MPERLLNTGFFKTLYNKNFDSLDTLIEYADSVGASIIFQPIRPVFNSKKFISSAEEFQQLFSSFLPGPEEYAKALQTIREYKRRGYNILLPDSYLSVYEKYFENPLSAQTEKLKVMDLLLYPTGEVKFRSDLLSLGNIKSKSVAELVSSEEAMRQKDMEVRKGSCLCELTPTSMDILKLGISHLRKLFS